MAVTLQPAVNRSSAIIADIHCSRSRNVRTGRMSSLINRPTIAFEVQNPRWVLARGRQRPQHQYAAVALPRLAHNPSASFAVSAAGAVDGGGAFHATSRPRRFLIGAVG